MTDEQVQAEPRLKVLKNGAIYDMDRGRIVTTRPELAQVDTQITQANTGAMAARRQELKRKRLLAGAARTLERGGEWDKPNDLDVVEALGEAVMMKALNPDSAKQVDAARFILQESGLSSSQERGDQNPEQPGAPKLILLLAQLHDRQPDVIVGQVTRSDILITDIDAHSSTEGEAGASPTADTDA